MSTSGHEYLRHILDEAEYLLAESEGLDRERVRIRAVWFVELGDERPRFVTAYPWKGGSR
jgi:hypothetical protein